MIMGEIRRHLRDDSMLHVSRSYKEKAGKIFKAKEEFLQVYGREPTFGQLAEILDMTTSDMVIVMEANQKPASLQTPLESRKSSQDGSSGELIDVIASLDGEEKWVESMELREIFKRLPERLQYIMNARYFKEETQEEIAKNLGISQVQVSRLEKQALTKLRAYWLGDEPTKF